MCVWLLIQAVNKMIHVDKKACWLTERVDCENDILVLAIDRMSWRFDSNDAYISQILWRI